MGARGSGDGGGPGPAGRRASMYTGGPQRQRMLSVAVGGGPRGGGRGSRGAGESGKDQCVASPPSPHPPPLAPLLQFFKLVVHVTAPRRSASSCAPQ